MNSILKYKIPTIYPEFIEGNIFKMIIPLNPDIDKVDDKTLENEGDTEGAIDNTFGDKLTKKAKEKLIVLLEQIAICEGVRMPFYRDKNGWSDKMTQRYLKRLREFKLVEFKGNSTQTGGYYLAQHLKDQLKN